MGTFLLLCVVGLLACIVVGTTAACVVRAIFWVVTLPFRIFFKILFGIGGAVIGLLVAPFFAIIVAIGVVVSVVVGVVSLLAPLLPVVLLGLFGWAVYRLAVRKPAAPPAPPPGFWS
jgi:hypothetical protein